MITNFAPFTCINIGSDENKELRVLTDLELECYSWTNTLWF